jgi:hypothetical protein
MLYFYTVLAAWQARRVLPALLMLAAQAAQYGIFGANLTFIPNSTNGSALALQLRLRVW